MTGKNMLLIRNPRAGSYKAQNTFIEAAALLFRSEYSAYMYSTQYPGDAARIVSEHGPDYDLIVCFGGDGTLNEVINGLMSLEERPVLGYIPAGTTNDFAQGLGLSRDILEAAGDILTGEVVPLDAGLFNGSRYFSYVASFGSFTKASYSTPQDIKNAIGYPAYLIEGLKSIGEIRPCPADVFIGDEKFSDEFVFGGIANSTSLGGLIRLGNNTVNLSDGLFEVLLIRTPRSFSAFQRIIYSLATQNYEDNEQVILRKSPNAKFFCEKPFAWTIDGEFGGLFKEVELKACHNVINIIKPNRHLRCGD